ncbi:RNA-binding transcriptional accessory protein [Christensenellaceae bacterium OttesenSCG-928-K19]|nr:RNA-binding transcriptional accessory protein [Christensenellaceae bacterium OttesenSCG-928-K19]
MDLEKQLAQEFGLKPGVIKNVVSLIDEGNTIPFIARYRKEMTGALDDQVLREVADRLAYLRNLQQRKAEVIAAVEEQGKLGEEWKQAVLAAVTLAEVEDLYRPYKQKRRTRAMVARERGLEPLAGLIMAQELTRGSMEEAAAPFVDAEKEVPDAQAALAGAMDIIAEDLSDSAALRKALRMLMQKYALIVTKAAKEEDSVYRLYYGFSEEAARIPSHRVLAINRGEKEGFLKVKVDVDDGAMIGVLHKYAIKNEKSICVPYIKQAAEDAWGRLLCPSLERELRAELTGKAEEQAIKMFGQNLKPTLMQPPLGGKVVLGFDPAYRTGCKLAVVDATGKVLDTDVIYPTPPNNKIEESKAVLKKLIAKHGIEVVAIGNGTASKESELFIAALLKELPEKVSYTMVNEAGASVYSASKLGAQEFPDYDVSLRSAVSIARRLQDPMAELVKIDPKAIGVGQYQHDMPMKRLDETLTGVVEDCVNSVGVDINTASPSLLAYVSGLTASTSRNISLYREENGAFAARTQIKKVKGLGPKAYEQCAGFLRIHGGKQILDNTAVHPESYGAAKKLLALFGYAEADIAAGKLDGLAAQVKARGEDQVAEECGVGAPTLRDIVGELQKPGRDIRDNMPKPVLRDDVMDINDLKPGMEFTGTVRNVIDFGAFVDIGVHQDGLVHISKLSNKYVKHPSEVAKVGDVVTVWVLAVDVEKNRISLSMVGPE